MARDRRTVGLMVGLPLLLLVVFGYAARFDVTSIDTIVVGPGAEELAAGLNEVYSVSEIDPSANRADAEQALRNSEAAVAIVAAADGNRLLIDGTELFVAQSALRRLPADTLPEVLFNPNLDTATVMVPSLIGLILLFIGTVQTPAPIYHRNEVQNFVEYKTHSFEYYRSYPYRPTQWWLDE